MHCSQGYVLYYCTALESDLDVNVAASSVGYPGSSECRVFRTADDLLYTPNAYILRSCAVSHLQHLSCPLQFG